MTEREGAVRRLRRERPRSLLVRWTAGLLGALVAGSWWAGDFDPGSFASERRLRNLERFLGEIRPFPLQGREFDWPTALHWAGGVFSEKGLSAALATLAISVAAIVLAGLWGALAAIPAARSLATPEPFLPAARIPERSQRLLWQAVTGATRLGLVFGRAVPEYIWAFLLLILLGPTAWPAVLALAIHNAGIVGKLTSEIVENLDSQPLAALRGLGATRSQITLTAIFPLVFNRFLLFFFYRWETCVRDATILGLLGIVSLGYWIQDARARNHYDEMLFLVLLGAGLVLLADLASALARELVRRTR